ncbi:hypothetical protein CLOM_g24514 [Closterium sp. NIES-68]|nr:hypothetical protein CLOM_g24514 [Closterium sp. NIES-68]GJP75515.1 hypothetical protein CLOP_g5952 [Closterium sp. NIES-67]
MATLSPPQAPLTDSTASPSSLSDVPASTFIASITAAFLAFVGLFLCLVFARWFVAPEPDPEEDRNNQRRRLHGLDKALVESFPTFVFAAEQAKESDCVSFRQCCICLSDYEPGDKIKSLPVCGHRFHESCIDMWLEGKRTCPVCRANLRPKKKTSSADDEHAEPDVAIPIGQPCDSGEQCCDGTPCDSGNCREEDSRSVDEGSLPVTNTTSLERISSASTPLVHPSQIVVSCEPPERDADRESRP